jgi:hypothetical protein
MDTSIDFSRKDELLVCEQAQRHEFLVGGKSCFLLKPQGALPAHKPWVWYAPTFVPKLPKHLHLYYISRLLQAGIHLGGMDIGESWGNPAGRIAFNTFHEHMIATFGLEGRACLLAQSRGGMMHYNWAVENPQKVKCVAGIYPMVTATEPLKQHVYEAHGLSEDAFKVQKVMHNPLDRIAPLAQACVPIYHIHGDADELVPFQPNAAEFVKRYRAAAQFPEMAQLEVVAGKGHEEVEELFTSQNLINWLIKQAIACDSNIA